MDLLRGPPDAIVRTGKVVLVAALQLAGSTSLTACDADRTLAGTAVDFYLTLWNPTSGGSVDLACGSGVMDARRNPCWVVWNR